MQAPPGLMTKLAGCGKQGFRNLFVISVFVKLRKNGHTGQAIAAIGHVVFRNLAIGMMGFVVEIGCNFMIVRTERRAFRNLRVLLVQ
jgi:hypothetical protein